MDTNTTPPRDNDRLTWHIRTRKYSDAETCHWRLYATAKVRIESKKCMHTTVVGEWEGRSHNRQHARKDASDLCRHLKDSRLYIIPITAKAINDGEERSCSFCAIAQALWHVQKFTWKQDPWFHSFRVDTYGAWREAKGIEYKGLHTERGRAVLPPTKLPDVVTNYRRGGKELHYAESMVAWTMGWDEWAEARYDSEKKEYNEGDGPPPRPSPGFFMLNADDFEVEETFIDRGMPCFVPQSDGTEDDE